MTSREHVFEAIAGEREYQDIKWNSANHSVVEFFVYMRDYLEEGLHMASRQSDTYIGNDLLDNARKVAALAVCCMEQHGAPRRDV